METRLIYHKDLLDFIASAEYRDMQYVPISPHRALSHLANPRALPDDLLLLLVYKDGVLQGYLGALPDDLYIDNRVFRMSWLSCMWVIPTARGQGIAPKMMSEILRLLDYRAIITDFAPETKKMYERLGFFYDWADTPALRAYLHPRFAHLLPARGGRWRQLSFVWRLADTFLWPFLALRLAFLRQNIQEIEVERTVTPAIAACIERLNPAEFMRRGAQEIAWILEYPWVLESGAEAADDFDPARYHFSSFARSFDTFLVPVQQPDQVLCGVLLCTLRERHLKVAAAWCLPEYWPLAAQLLRRLALQRRANMVTVSHKDLIRHLTGKRCPFLFWRRIARTYIVSKTLSLPETAFFQGGDGDVAFT